MSEDKKNTEQKTTTQETTTQKTTQNQENNNSEPKKETSDVQLLLQSKEKMKAVEGSHMNFSEASKMEKNTMKKNIIELEKKVESDTKKDSSDSDKKSSKDE